MLIFVKNKNNCEEIVCLRPAGSQICRGFKEHDLITSESEVQVVVSQGSEFCASPSTRIQLFFNPQLFLSGFKIFPVHT